jgi:hypothetical protein
MMMGSHGQITADMRSGRITVTSFLESPPKVDARRTELALQVGSASPGVIEEVTEAFTGHGGGDAGLMSDFTERVRRWMAGEDAGSAPSSLEESLESHLVAFAAERSRLRLTIEEL